MNAQIVQSTDATFDQDVMQSDQVVLLDFSAPRCAPCRALEPLLRAIAERYVTRVKVIQINVDTERAIAERFNIRSIPTCMVIRSGEVIGRNIQCNKLDLRKALDDALEGKSISAEEVEVEVEVAETEISVAAIAASPYVSFQNDPARKTACLRRLSLAVSHGTLGKGTKNSPSSIAAGGPGFERFIAEFGVLDDFRRLYDLIFWQLASQDVAEATQIAFAWLESMPVGVDMTGVGKAYYAWLLHDPRWGMTQYIHKQPVHEFIKRLGVLQLQTAAGNGIYLSAWHALNDDVREYASSAVNSDETVDIGAAMCPLNDPEHLGLDTLHAYLESLATRAASRTTGWTLADAQALRTLEQSGNCGQSQRAPSDVADLQYTNLCTRRQAHLLAVDNRASDFHRAAAEFLMNKFRQA